MVAYQRDISFRWLSRIAGVAYLIIIACGLFAEFAVREALFVEGDATKTFSTVVDNAGLFRAGIAADLIMLVADVAVAWALYLLLSPIDRSLALLATLGRVVQASVIAVGVVRMATIWALFPEGFVASQLQGVIAFHNTSYLVGLIFFGIACIAIGRLLIGSGFAPKALGVFLILAGIGYWIDSFGQILFWEYPESLSMIVLLPAFIGEFWFCGWLLVRGFGKAEWPQGSS